MTTLVMLPPFAVKVAVALTVVGVVGVKRIVTACVAPTPVSVNGLPDTIVNGGATAALPDTVPPAVLETVNVRSVELPRSTLPKFSVPLGLTSNSALAAALAVGEQALSLPSVSSAVTATKYTVPGASPVSRRLTLWFVVGLAVGDATERNEDPGQGEGVGP
jgi:hypothetical protein